MGGGLSPAKPHPTNGGYAPDHLRSLFFVLLDHEEDDAEANRDRVALTVSTRCGGLRLHRRTDNLDRATGALNWASGKPRPRAIALKKIRDHIRVGQEELDTETGWLHRRTADHQPITRQPTISRSPDRW